MSSILDLPPDEFLFALDELGLPDDQREFLLSRYGVPEPRPSVPDDRSFGYHLLDNLIGFDDDYVTRGEALKSGISDTLSAVAADPLGAARSVAKSVPETAYDMLDLIGRGVRNEATPLEMLEVAAMPALGPLTAASRTRRGIASLADYDPTVTSVFGSRGSRVPEGAKVKPQMGEAFDDWIERIYAPENRGPGNVVQDENVVFRAMSPEEAQAGEAAGVFRDLSGQPLYVANDPERYIGGGAYGGKGQGRIYEFDVTGLPSEVRRGGVGIQERAISELPTDRVRRVWEWNPGTKAHELLVDNTRPQR